MNKAAPWSIKGVDFDARDAAREAAQREGMTLGEWLNDVISERAAESGESPDDFGEDDRLNAVAARLARMRDGGARVRRRDDRRRDEARDRAALEQQLRAAFRGEANETSLAGWTPLGNYELQRKRDRLPLRQILGG